MQHILISRTDAIGDVVLTLPVCGIIKHYLPDCIISFIGNTYTREVISASKYVDNFVNYDDWATDAFAVTQLQEMDIDTIIHVFPKMRIASIASRAGIKNRIGTTNRFYHWLYCNELIKLSRKNSDLHESQLNIKLLKGLELDTDVELKAIYQFYGFDNIKPLNDSFNNLLSDTKFNLVIHPKSSGSSKEWSLERYSQLISLLDPDKFKLFITGSEKEKGILTKWIDQHEDKVTNLTGKFNLSQFLSFIKAADGLIAASTGPVHLAAAAGINALGLYPNSVSINARRWSPLGYKASYVEADDGDINSIQANKVLSTISNWVK